MDEVDKMRSSQLANTASPEIQERFKRAKKLLLKLNAMRKNAGAYWKN